MTGAAARRSPSTVPGTVQGVATGMPAPRAPVGLLWRIRRERPHGCGGDH